MSAHNKYPFEFSKVHCNSLQLFIESYLVFYVIRGRTIEIHRIVYGSRHLGDIILY
jgi:hypothetical protein